MQTLDSWQEYWNEANAFPKPKSEGLSYIQIKGFFDAEVKYESDTLPPEFQDRVNSIEEILTSSFPFPMQGVQTPDTRDPTDDRRRYSGIFVGCEEAYREVNFFMDAFHSQSHNKSFTFPASLSFDAVFPLGEHTEKSKQAIEQLWPLIDSIQFTGLINGERYGIQQELIDNQHILLVENNNPVAQGWPALKKIGLNVPEKKLTKNGQYLI